MVLSLSSVIYLLCDFGKVKLDVCYFEIFYDPKETKNKKTTFSDGSEGKESSCNAGDTGDSCLTPG